MPKLILAICVQILAFGIYFYIDARQTTAQNTFAKGTLIQSRDD